MEDSKHSTILLTNLNPNWFDWSDPTKMVMLGPGISLLKESCSDKMSRMSILSVDRSRDQVPKLGCAGVSASLIIAEERTSLTITLNDSCHCRLLEETASSLQLKLIRRTNISNSYILTGHLDVITDFHKTFDKNVLHSKGSPVSSDGLLIEKAEVSDGGSGSAMTTSFLAINSSHFPEKFFEKVQKRFDSNALVIMKDNVIQGVHYALLDGAVFMDKAQIQDRDATVKMLLSHHANIVQLKLKAEEFQIPPHMSVHFVQETVKSLKRQYNRCAFFITEDILLVKLVSSSDRQFNDVKKKLRDALGVSDTLSFSLPYGRMLILKKGNIVDEQVDVIVNAANSRLEHGGGVALAIDKASNFEVGQHSRRYIQNHKPVKVGNVAVTGAGGSLRCSYIIHAVGPVKTDPDCRGMLNKLMHNILGEAEKLDTTSIAIPAISSGIFGVDKNLVASCVFNSILSHNFNKPLPVLGSIRVTIIDQPTYDCFCNHMKSLGDSSGSNMLSYAKVTSFPGSDGGTGDCGGGVGKGGGGTGDGGGGVGKGGGGVGKGGGGVGKGGGGVGKGGGGVGKGSGGVGKGDGGGVGKNGGGGVGKGGKGVGKGDGGGVGKGGGGVGKGVGKGGEGVGEGVGKGGEGVGKGIGKGDDGVGNSVGGIGDGGRGVGKGDGGGVGNSVGGIGNSGRGVGKGGEGVDAGYGKSETECGDLGGAGNDGGSEKGRTGSVTCGPNSSFMSPPPQTSTGANIPMTSSVWQENQWTSPQPSTGPVNNPPGMTPQHSSGSNPPGMTPQHSSGSNPPGMTPQHSSGSYPPGMNPSAVVFDGSYPKCVFCYCAQPNDQMSLCYKGHLRCKDCLEWIEQYFPYCPVCLPEIRAPYSFPLGATIDTEVLNSNLPGHLDVGTIEIIYKVLEDRGSHGSIMGLSLRAYLPNNDEGIEVAHLFKREFDALLTFTTLLPKSRVVCTHSYHKTRVYGGGLLGYPDDSYLPRVKEFLTRKLRRGT